MEINASAIDDAILALLSLDLALGSHYLTSKKFNKDSLDRLFKRGLIEDPDKEKNQLSLSEEGFGESERLFAKLFTSVGSE